MAEYSGSACYGSWIWSGGTVVISSDNRKITLNESGSPIDATAGSDANRVRLAGIGDASIAWEFVVQDGTAGTIAAAAFRKNNVGTLIVGPGGTATGSVKWTLPAIISTSNIQVPFADVVTGNVEFMNNTASGLTIGAY